MLTALSGLQLCRGSKSLPVGSQLNWAEVTDGLAARQAPRYLSCGGPCTKHACLS